jgi:hypothetical protein
MALCASVFDPLPREGRWGAAVLLDGNLGIGGDSVRLLTRLRTLLRPGGRVLAEAEAPGVASRSTHLRMQHSAWQPWAVVSVDDVEQVASAAGFRLDATRPLEGRWFALLDA